MGLAVTRNMFSFAIGVSKNAQSDKRHLLMLGVILRNVFTIVPWTVQSC